MSHLLGEHMRCVSSSKTSDLTENRSDDGYPAPTLRAPAPLKRFSSAYDDPFSDVPSSWDAPPAEPNIPESPTVERDNKLLGFSTPIQNFALLDFSGRRTTLSMSAQLHGMFFLAESPWAASGENAAPSTELTCYRRNLFQISGSATIPQTLHYILTEQGDRVPILGQELVVSATESVEGNPVKLISVPWKTPSSTPAVQEDKTEKEPNSIVLDLTNNAEIDSEYATFPIAWKRLQFRIATANNGRRKELQQHFVVRLKIMATLATGGKVAVSEARSGAIIVRGRSPRNFKSGKDLPLSVSASTSRRNAANSAPPPPMRTSTSESLTHHATGETAGTPEFQRPQLPFERSELELSPGFLDWIKMAETQPGTLAALSEPAVPSLKRSPSSFVESSMGSATPIGRIPSTPINLNLVEDDGGRKRPTSSRPESNPKSSKAQRLTPMPPRPLETASARMSNMNSPDGDEGSELLYEYFPLGLDDWMPPVDAVYRPHVVHHTNPAPDPKAKAAKDKSTRYFSREE